MFGAREDVDRFLKVIEKKNLFLATGVKDDYVLIYLGGSMDGFQLADLYLSRKCKTHKIRANEATTSTKQIK